MGEMQVVRRRFWQGSAPVLAEAASASFRVLFLILYPARLRWTAEGVPSCASPGLRSLFVSAPAFSSPHSCWLCLQHRLRRLKHRVKRTPWRRFAPDSLRRLPTPGP